MYALAPIVNANGEAKAAPAKFAFLVHFSVWAFKLEWNKKNKISVKNNFMD